MTVQLFKHHPTIGYTFIPNLKTRIDHEGGGYLLRTNEAGFRCNHEFRSAKTAGKMRILLFGDSFTAGDGVSNGKRYCEVLEAAFPSIEIYNFALPGTGTDQQYLVWREIAHDFDYDLVVIAVQAENIRRNVARYRPSVTSEGVPALLAKPYFEMVNDTLVLKGVPVPSEPITPETLSENDRAYVDQGGRLPWLRSAVNKMGGSVKDLAQRVSGYQPLPEYDSAHSPEWLLMCAMLKQWVGEVDSPVVLMPIPLYQYVEETASSESFRSRFKELSDQCNVTLHDPTGDYETMARPERRALRFDTDIHPTVAHHRLLAESLKAVLPQFVDSLCHEVTAK